MTFKLSQRSLNTLSRVDSRMQRVVRRAIEITEVDFVVVQGLRTRDEQMRLYGKGRDAAQMLKAGLPVAYAAPSEKKVTWTMNSNHLSGRAVDLAAYVDGKIDWVNIDNYRKIAAAMKQAAMELCVVIEWGGDWGRNKDYPHFEIKRGT